jgi:hypothetical protein
VHGLSFGLGFGIYFFNFSDRTENGDPLVMLRSCSCIAITLAYGTQFLHCSIGKTAIPLSPLIESISISIFCMVCPLFGLVYFAFAFESFIPLRQPSQ